MTARFEALCRRREQAALAADIPGYATVQTVRREGMVAIGSAWTDALFDGPFYLSAVPAAARLPIVSLVFVRTRDGNTEAADPSTLGGGATDLHLVYEGLSRVDADAVLAGSTTARGRETVFSIWHPELVALRLARGRPRHPAQVVVTATGDLRFEDALMFQEPELRVFVMTHSGAVQRIRDRIAGRTWIEVIDGGAPMSLARALGHLHNRGIDVLSCVGGRVTATALINERLVRDIYLTTATTEGGEPGTPFYTGPSLPLARVLLKEGREAERGVRFEHLLVKSQPPRSDSHSRGPDSET